MNTSIGKLTSFLLFVLALAGCADSSNPAAPGRPGTVVASGHPEWPPIMFQQGSAIDGAGAALLTKILRDLGVQVTMSYAGTWDDVQAKARKGDVDMLVAAYKTQEREEYMVYSDAYTTDPVAIFVPAGRSFPFDTWDALAGKRGIAMFGDSYGQAFDEFAAEHLGLTRVTTADEGFAAITRGDGDYFLYSLFAGDDYLKKAGLASQYESLPTFVSEEPFYITISKRSPFISLLPQINAAIAKYKADGTIHTLIEQYKKR